MNHEFKPHHINATTEDLAGNQGNGRFVFLPGSDGRAREIADHFSCVEVRASSRAHNLYLGRLESANGAVDVASVASGMGTPSLDIIVNELINLGARRILRVGTAGSMQPHRIKVGHLAVATAAVRDEGASRAYAPLEFPAVASHAMLRAVAEATAVLGNALPDVHWGIVHSKDSLFAREFKEGPLAHEHERYMAVLHRLGVVASEMEASHLFVLSSYFSRKLEGAGPFRCVDAGTILAIIGDDGPFAPPEQAKEAIDKAVALALETARQIRW